MPPFCVPCRWNSLLYCNHHYKECSSTPLRSHLMHSLGGTVVHLVPQDIMLPQGAAYCISCLHTFNVAHLVKYGYLGVVDQPDNIIIAASVSDGLRAVVDVHHHPDGGHNKDILHQCRTCQETCQFGCVTVAVFATYPQASGQSCSSMSGKQLTSSITHSASKHKS